MAPVRDDGSGLAGVVDVMAREGLPLQAAEERLSYGMGEAPPDPAQRLPRQAGFSAPVGSDQPIEANSDLDGIRSLRLSRPFRGYPGFTETPCIHPWERQ